MLTHKSSETHIQLPTAAAKQQRIKIFLNVSFSQLISAQQSSSLVTGEKSDDRKTHKPAATESGCSEGLEKHLQRGNSEFSDVYGLQWIFIQELKLPL